MLSLGQNPKGISFIICVLNIFSYDILPFAFPALWIICLYPLFNCLLESWNFFLSILYNEDIEICPCVCACVCFVNQMTWPPMNFQLTSYSILVWAGGMSNQNKLLNSASFQQKRKAGFVKLLNKSNFILSWFERDAFFLSWNRNFFSTYSYNCSQQ